MVRFLQLRGGARGVRATDGEEVGPLLDEQRAYDRALAADYLDQGLDLPGGDEVTEALDAFQPNGSVLELACGPGVWTGQLLRHASEVTAVDASPEMLAIAAARVGDERVRFIAADLCSSPTTPTAPRTSSWKAHHPRPSADSSLTEPPTGS